MPTHEALTACLKRKGISGAQLDLANLILSDINNPQTCSTLVGRMDAGGICQGMHPDALQGYLAARLDAAGVAPDDPFRSALRECLLEAPRGSGQDPPRDHGLPGLEGGDFTAAGIRDCAFAQKALAQARGKLKALEEQAKALQGVIDGERARIDALKREARSHRNAGLVLAGIAAGLAFWLPVVAAMIMVSAGYWLAKSVALDIVAALAEADLTQIIASKVDVEAAIATAATEVDAALGLAKALCDTILGDDRDGDDADDDGDDGGDDDDDEGVLDKVRGRLRDILTGKERKG